MKLYKEKGPDKYKQGLNLLLASTIQTQSIKKTLFLVFIF